VARANGRGGAQAVPRELEGAGSPGSQDAVEANNAQMDAVRACSTG
jgi:hypothetical protein